MTSTQPPRFRCADRMANGCRSDRRCEKPASILTP
ncbi:MAG TPA: hypothetical protein DCX60_09420 [Phycisphaerales bacterium]|nr:hypothetical protein [Phycisphaerales bacterium]